MSSGITLHMIREEIERELKMRRQVYAKVRGESDLEQGELLARMTPANRLRYQIMQENLRVIEVLLANGDVYLRV